MSKLHAIAAGVRAGHIRAIGKAITLVESCNLDHSLAATTLLDELLPQPDNRSGSGSPVFRVPGRALLSRRLVCI